MFKIIFSLLLCSLAFNAYSASAVDDEALVCANGAPPGNDELLKSFQENVDPLKMAFLDSRRSPEPIEEPVCEPIASPKAQMSQLQKVARSLMFWKGPETPQEPHPALKPKAKPKMSLILEPVGPNTPMILERACIAASLQRRAGREEYICSFPKGKSGPHAQTLSKKEGIAGNTVRTKKVAGKKGQKPKTVITSTSNQAQCYTEEMVDYMQFAVNQAIRCLSPDEPIDTRYIAKKFNAETGFNFSVSWNGGRGLSQITSAASQELSNPKKGNGVYILEEVANSKKPSCAAFKDIAKEDLASPQRIEGDNVCDWVSPGDGLARNLLYGVGYHIHMRDKYIRPLLPDKLAANKDIVNSLTTMSFGREGIKGVRTLLKNNRVSNGTSSENLLAVINKRSAYVRENNLKQHEMLCMQKNMMSGNNDSCKDMKFSDREIAGDTCVSKP